MGARADAQHALVRLAAVADRPPHVWLAAGGPDACRIGVFPGRIGRVRTRLLGGKHPLVHVWSGGLGLDAAPDVSSTGRPSSPSPAVSRVRPIGSGCWGAFQPSTHRGG